MSSAESELSRERTPSPPHTETERSSPTVESPNKDSTPEDKAVIDPIGLTLLSRLNGQDGDRPTDTDDKPVNMMGKLSPSSKSEDRGHPERKRRASNDSADSSTRASDTGTMDTDIGKDDDDDDDNDDDEIAPPTGKYDPERLKSFNMFVRLFVDENLDRTVPISKQPKDKVQAILEACDRQFAEFHERSRKRIRTYLKSCRRMRRTKDQNGWEPIRPTPPHLTSATAEALLATACENESSNAKRMRMGLEPLPASVMNSIQNNNSSGGGASTPSGPGTSLPLPTVQTPTQTAPQTTQSSRNSPQTTTSQASSQPDRHVPTSDFLRHQPPPPAFRPPHEFHPPFFPNGNGLFRPGFPASYTPPAHHHPPVIQHTALPPTSIQNGTCPTDLSMKKSNSKNQLSSSEISTIKQLIAGYRESAAFLYRSADELEQLLLQQN